MFYPIIALMVSFVAFLAFLQSPKRKPVHKLWLSLICVVVIAVGFLYIRSRTQEHFYPSKETLIQDVIEGNVIGAIEGKASCFFAYRDFSTGVPECIVAEKSEGGYKLYQPFKRKVASEFWIDRYAVEIIEWGNGKDYYVLISGAVIEDVVGKLGKVVVTDNIGSEFTVYTDSELVNGNHTQTRIIAFAFLDSWSENTYELMIKDAMGTHKE